MPKGIPKNGKRKISTVKCKICKSNLKLNGFDSHLKHKHNISCVDYRNKYGEYRPKQLDYEERSDSKYKCKIDGKECASERHLSYYVRMNYGLSKREYIIQHIFQNKLPTCKCGCGELVTLKNQYPYHSEYISGHNIYDTHLGSKRSKKSRMKMRRSRIKYLKEGDSIFHNHGPSKAEQSICDFICENYDGEVIQNNTTILSGLELDIYVPDKKLAIEYNGSRFHSTEFKEKRYHLNKTKECNENDIHLIHIWEPDWIKNKDIVKSILLSQLNNNKHRVYARQCELKELDFQTTKRFLIKNHLQGNSVSSIRCGLYFNDELIQVMTFGKLRKATGQISKEGSFELLRFCSKQNYSVVGGASKLFTFFINNHNPMYVLSFANKDWATGNVYEKLGFKFIKFTTPGYFYVKGKRKYHRYKFQKHKLVEEGEDPILTESEIMYNRGYYKIWNTGNYKFEWYKK